MTIKVGRTIVKNIFTSFAPNPITYVIPIFGLMLFLPVVSLLQGAYDDAQEQGVENLPPDPTSMLFILLLPMIIIAMMIPMLTGLSGSPNIGGILKTANIEKRMEKLKQLGAAEFIKQTEARLVDSSPRGNKLYTSKKILEDKNVDFLIYTDKSTDREYISFVPNNFVNADEAMAWKFQLSKIEYSKLARSAEA